jgi:hypothetical protein
MLRMVDSQGIQTETLSPGMQAMLQQQWELMRRQNQITGSMLQLLERLQETTEMRADPAASSSTTPSAMRPPSEPPSAAWTSVVDLIPVMDLTATEEVVDLTATDEAHL